MYDARECIWRSLHDDVGMLSCAQPWHDDLRTRRAPPLSAGTRMSTMALLIYVRRRKEEVQPFQDCASTNMSRLLRAHMQEPSLHAGVRNKLPNVVR